MTAPRIAVCLVVTDDAGDVHGCLQSMRQLGPLLAQLCVYGVGACESTLALARNAGAKVEMGKWDGDASAARNAAACMSDAPWVLVAEPNERLRVDVANLSRLLDLPKDMVGEPDALTIDISTGRGPGARASRGERIYRPERAHFVGTLEEHLEPLEPGRPLRTLSAGAEVIGIWSVVDDLAQPGSERDRLRRREGRARAAVDKLEAAGIRGNDLVTALVERSRVRRELGDDDGALDDLNRARRVEASDAYRWRAREDLTTLLIEHGYYEGANRLIGELRADGADESYSDWLCARVHAAQGQAHVAWDILRRLQSVTSSEGRVVAPLDILTEQMHLANRLGEFDEALHCCIDLVTRHNLGARHGRMLLKLWGPRSPEGLSDLLIQADARHLDDVAGALEALPGLGPDVAARLREVRAERPTAVRIM
ncbi:MAG: hypothetical protein Q4P32_09875 [Micrococcales bacterium]|nr:hypothetical protein [Micrococcales bacterium]